MADEPAEVLPEEAREHDEREQDRREDGQALDDEVQAVRDRREVDVHRAGEEILVAVDQVGDADQVVEDVAEVALGLGVAARKHGRSAEELARHVALRADDAPQAVQLPLHAHDLLQVLVLGVAEDLVLDTVDPLVVVLERREEAVGEAVDQAVEDDDRPLELARLARVALAELIAARRVLSPHRDEVALRVEDVHLDEAVRVGRGRGPVDDEEDEVVVLLQLRPLAELLGVLERERVEAEDVAQELEVVRLGVLEVEPEEISAREPRLDRGPVDLRVLVGVEVEKRGGHGSPVTLTPLEAL